MLTLIPAYGRDYKSLQEVKAAFKEGKDFQIANCFHPDDGRYANLEDLTGKEKQVMIRYKKLTQICVINL